MYRVSPLNALRIPGPVLHAATSTLDVLLVCFFHVWFDISSYILKGSSYKHASVSVISSRNQ